MTAPRSPVPGEVSAELRRVVERWHQLPLDHALLCGPAVRVLVQALAAEASVSRGGDPGAASLVPDLGPAVLMDQLSVIVHDWCASGSTEQAGQLVPRLAQVRRALTARG